VAARGSAPVLGAICDAGNDEAVGVGGAISQSLSSASRWSISTGYRWQDSYRHFVGDVEQTQRILQQTQVENKIHLMDVGVSYQLTPRWTLSASAPIMKAERISHRTMAKTHSTGIGDMSIGATAWIFRPPSENHMNVQVGFALKLPTGISNITNRAANGTVTAVDQSIQLGDGGTGFTLSYAAYKSIHRFTVYSSGSYLFNPMNTNGVRTGRGRASEAIMSVADQYLWQGGLGYAVPKLRGLAFTFGGRMEGVPAYDLLGKSDGFRRPGYAVSVVPGLQFEHGKDMWSLNVAIAVRRDRTVSTSDKIDHTHGDAAFADSVFMMGYSRSF